MFKGENYVSRTAVTQQVQTAEKLLFREELLLLGFFNCSCLDPSREPTGSRYGSNATFTGIKLLSFIYACYRSYQVRLWKMSLHIHLFILYFRGAGLNRVHFVSHLIQCFMLKINSPTSEFYFNFTASPGL